MAGFYSHRPPRMTAQEKRRRSRLKHGDKES
jgi:hypothetical protein